MNKKKWISAFVCLSMMASMYPTVGAVDATENTTAASEDGKLYSINTHADSNADTLGYYSIQNVSFKDGDGKTVEVAANEYTITSDDTKQDSDSTLYYRNKTVTVSVSKTGYTASKVEYTTANGVTKTAEKSADNTFTFAMPTYDITELAVTLAADSTDVPDVPTDKEYTITATPVEVEHGSFTVDKTKAKAGTKVTITPTAADGYGVKSVTVSGVDADKVTKNEDGTYSFTMPEADVTVTVEFAEKAKPVEEVKADTTVTDGAASATVEDATTEGSNLKAQLDTIIANKDTAGAEENSTLNIVAKADTDSDVKKAEVKLPTATIGAINDAAKENENLTVAIDTNVGKVTVNPAVLEKLAASAGDNGVTLNVDQNKKTEADTDVVSNEIYDINFGNVEITETPETKYEIGLELDFDMTSAVTGGRYSIGWKSDKNGTGKINDVEWTKTGTNWHAKFTIRHLTEISVQSTDIYKVNVDSAIEGGTVTTDVAEAAEGDTVTITATPSEGYKDGKVTVTDAKGNAVTVTDGKFTMPAGDVTISATFEKKENTDPTPGDVAVTGVTLDQTAASIKVGETVTLTATVTPDDATHKDVTWESNNTAVATVEGGVVTGVSAGTATITATAGDKSATCVVTVAAAEENTDAADKAAVEAVAAKLDSRYNFTTKEVADETTLKTKLVEIVNAAAKELNIEGVDCAFSEDSYFYAGEDANTENGSLGKDGRYRAYITLKKGNASKQVTVRGNIVAEKAYDFTFGEEVHPAGVGYSRDIALKGDWDYNDHYIIYQITDGKGEEATVSIAMIEATDSFTVSYTNAGAEIKVWLVKDLRENKTGMPQIYGTEANVQFDKVATSPAAQG